MNANDSYWLPNPKQPLEGYAGIIGCEQCERTLRTRMVDRYVLDRLAGTDGLASNREVSQGTLQATEHVNRVFGAELARQNGDLDTVCEAADGGASCPVLHRWDGHSDIDSVGTQIFQEFWKRAEGVPALWEVPFDPADPVNTPRDLNEKNPQVVQAMKDAIAYLASKHVSPTATWGSLQVAGDDGAPAIPIGGGEGFAGNANARLEPQAGREPVAALPDQLRLLAHPGDQLPARRQAQRAHDPDLRRVAGPDPDVVERPDPAVQPGEVGVVPVDVAAGRRRRGEDVRRARRLSAAARSPGDGDPGC